MTSIDRNGIITFSFGRPKSQRCAVWRIKICHSDYAIARSGADNRNCMKASWLTAKHSVA